MPLLPPDQYKPQQPPPYSNKTSSVDDLNSGDSAANRQSGIGALGMGLLNMNDDDDDDDDGAHRMPQLQPPASTPTLASKHMALAAATSAANSPRSPPPQYIAAPRPGYAAPIAALNLARPEPAAFPTDRKQSPPAFSVGANPFEPKDPFDNVLPSPRTSYHPMPSPSPTRTEPHPLRPPMTPITPVFARPSQPGITFSNTAVPRPRKPIMRGDTEGTLLPSRGEKGDDFWRRFSMVVKVEKGQKESTWLRKTQDGSTRLSRWVWLIGIFLLVCIGAAIAIGYTVSHNAPSYQQPKAFGGSANESAVPSSSQPATTPASGTSAISPLVQPTYTVARRASEPSGLPAAQDLANVVHDHKRRTHMH